MRRYDQYNSHLHLLDRRRVKRRTPSAGSGVDEAKAQYIRQVAAEVPRFTPAEVHAEIYNGRGRRDIPLQMVREVLAERS